jgi:hypothetical protein
MKDMNWPERVAYLENQLANSDRDNQHLRDFIEGLADGDEIVRLRGLLRRIHGIAAEPRPVNMAVRLENIACIASGERDATYAQSVEEQRFPHGAPAVQEVMCEACKGEGAYAGTDRICLTCSGLGTLRYKGGAPAEWSYAQAMCREDLPNAEIVALRVKFYNVERDLEDSEADNVRLRGLLRDIETAIGEVE